jgi:hypothetical protein
MADFYVAVRTAAGAVERYTLIGARDWVAAREHVLNTLNPKPRAVLLCERESQPELELAPAPEAA